jgi:hypothetical protein
MTYMLENIEEVIKNGQSRETSNIRYTRRRKTERKTQRNMRWTPLCVRHHYALDTTMRKQTQNKVNKTLTIFPTMKLLFYFFSPKVEKVCSFFI